MTGADCPAAAVPVGWKSATYGAPAAGWSIATENAPPAPVVTATFPPRPSVSTSGWPASRDGSTADPSGLARESVPLKVIAGLS